MIDTKIIEKLGERPSPFVVMGVGVPGSGKSTFLKELANELGIVRICPDDIREELTGDAADQTVHAKAWGIAAERVEEQIINGNSVIIDGTHTEDWRRPKAINDYKSKGALTVVAIVMKTPLETAFARNSRRDRVVPNNVITRMYQELLAKPPSYNEGFTEIIDISSTD